MKTVATFVDAHEAHMARGLLESRGIPAVVVDEHSAAIQTHIPLAAGGVRLQVPDGLAEPAYTILSNLDAEAGAELDDTVDLLDEIGLHDEALPRARVDHIEPHPAGGIVDSLTDLHTCPHCGLLVKEPERSHLLDAVKWLLAAFFPIRFDEDGPQTECPSCQRPLYGDNGG